MSFSAEKGRCALVTGGAGFIGSHLVDCLLDAGWKVTVLDNFSTGRLDNLSQAASKGARVVNGSVVDAQAVEKAMVGIDVVFHLAALADIVPSIKDPISYFEANVVGTATVVQAAKNLGVKKFVYAASSSCYGLAREHPTTEDADIRPQYPYALTKWLGEELVRHWGSVYKFPWISLRLFNVYGSRGRTSGTYGAVMGVFLAQKLAGAPLTIVGDGTQTRDFTHVSDVARAFLRAAESEVQGEALNVGSGATYSVNYLAELIGGDRVRIPERPGEPKVTFADTRKIAEFLGWEPQVSFESGVAGVLGEIENWRKAPIWNPRSIKEATLDWFTYLGDDRLNRD